MGTSIIASKKNWVEGNAIEQLQKTSELPGMREAVGMPDLHPGKDSPIGAVYATQGIVYPHLVGNDIGCGMALWRLSTRIGKLKFDKLEKQIDGLDDEWGGDTHSYLEQEGVARTAFDAALGTVGRGNHFAELQRLHQVIDEQFCDSFGLNKQNLYLLVHSGSRAFGESILHAHTGKFANSGVDASSHDGRAYLSAHDHAVAWARANRKLIAQRMMMCIGCEGTRLLDVCHNCVKQGQANGEPCWLHRKGAAPSDEGPVVIPGSRGSLSYLVVATGDQSTNLATVAHGAGRKWRRSECRGRLEKRYTRDDLKRTQLGSRVICEDKELLYEEAPEAYKNIDVVVQDLVDAGVIRVVAVFAPVITYKTRDRR